MLHRLNNLGESTWAAGVMAYAWPPTLFAASPSDDVNTRLILVGAAITLVLGRIYEFGTKGLELYKSKKKIDDESDHGLLLQAQATILRRDESCKEQIDWLKVRLSEARDDAEKQRSVIVQQNEMIASIVQRATATANRSVENTSSALSKIPDAAPHDVTTDVVVAIGV